MKVTIKEIEKYHQESAEFWNRNHVPLKKLCRPNRDIAKQKEQWHRAAVATLKSLDSAPET